MPPEGRWVIVVSDGLHTWLGRNSDPSEGKIAAAEAMRLFRIS